MKTTEGVQRKTAAPSVIQAAAVWIACLCLAGVGWAESRAVNANPEGELRVELIAAATPEYITEWVSTLYEHDIHVEPMRVARPEQTFYVAVTATGYQLNPQQMTDLVSGWRLIGPKGTVLIDQNEFSFHKKRMTHRSGFVMLDPAIDLTLQETDERGSYSIEAIVMDRISGKTATGSYQITLADEGSD